MFNYIYKVFISYILYANSAVAINLDLAFVSNPPNDIGNKS